MRRICVLVLVSAAAAAGAQTSLDKVPRPVYFAPPQVSVTLDKESSALISGIPEMLSTSIAALQAFERVDSADRARSMVTVSAAAAAPGGTTVSIQLTEAGSKKSESSHSFAGSSLDLAAFRSFIQATAAQFAPLLDPVAPETSVLKVSAQTQLIQAAKETDYLDQLDKRWEFTLWMSGLEHLLDSTGLQTNGAAYFGLDLLPMTLEADWFPGRNIGMQFSLFVNDTDAFDFGQHNRGDAWGLFLFGGVGVIYRTLGELSAEYAISASLGYIHLTATTGDVVGHTSHQSSDVVQLAKGSSTWSSLSLLFRVSPALVWSITPSVALKTTISFDLILPGMFPWYTDSPLADFRYLSLGVAYRL